MYTDVVIFIIPQLLNRLLVVIIFFLEFIVYLSIFDILILKCKNKKYW